AGHEQLAAAPQAQVAGAQEAFAGPAVQRGGERRRALVRLPPVALRDARAARPDLAHLAVGDLAAVRSYDRDLLDGGAAAHQLARVSRGGSPDAAPARADEQRRLGEAVAGHEGVLIEAGAAEALGEPPERAGAHRLGAVVGGGPASQVETSGLLLGDAVD